MDEQSFNASGNRQVLREIENNSNGTVSTSKNQSPSNSETPNSTKKNSQHIQKFPKSNARENFRNALLLDDDKVLSDELPDIVKVSPQLISISVDSPTTSALKSFDKLTIACTSVSTNKASSSEHSDDEFTECQSYLSPANKGINIESNVTDNVSNSPDSTTKSASSTQEAIVENSDKEKCSNLNKSFPIKSPQKSTFPVIPTPINDLSTTPSRSPNRSFAASSEALNSTSNITQEHGAFEGDEKKNAINCTSSFMSANATIPTNKIDSGFASTNLEDNQNVTASFVSANHTINVDLDKTLPLDKTSVIEHRDSSSSEDQSNYKVVSTEFDLNVKTTDSVEDIDSSKNLFVSGNQTSNVDLSKTLPLDKISVIQNHDPPFAENQPIQKTVITESDLNVTTTDFVEDIETEEKVEENISRCVEGQYFNKIENESAKVNESNENEHTIEQKGLSDSSTNNLTDSNADQIFTSDFDKVTESNAKENKVEKQNSSASSTFDVNDSNGKEDKVEEHNLTKGVENDKLESDDKYIAQILEETTAPSDGELNESLSESSPNKSKPVNMHESMSMDVDIEDVEIHHDRYEQRATPMEVESNEIVKPEALDLFDQMYLSDKEKHNLNNEKEDKEETRLCQLDEFQAQAESQLYQNEQFDFDQRVIYDPSAFEFLESKGTSQEESKLPRTSLLLKFDPFFSQQSVETPKVNQSLAEVKEEPENDISPALLCLNKEEHLISSPTLTTTSPGIQITTKSLINNEKMSVEVIQEIPMENNDIKSFENVSSINEKQFKMDDDQPENKSKSEVARNDEIEKKLKDSEQREEALLKRITEKDKTISKMTGVIEAYEKAIAELIAEKEKLSQNSEKELNEVKADRDSNYYHLTSLETTFSDLNIKYEKNKELLSQVKASEEKLLAERKVNGEHLKMQEQRYEKMKNHAMTQLEIANQKIEDFRKQHTQEVARLKAILKKEEIARAAVSDQLQQKTKENEQLMKICDELINAQPS